MMTLVTDIPIINGWFVLLGVLGVLMLAIGNLLLLPPVATAVQNARPVKPAPIFTRNDLWS